MIIIKSHIRGGYRDAAAYLKAQGKNEKVRTIELSDIEAQSLDQGFQNMWAVASQSKVKKPLHHISINPQKDEHLTEAQFFKIVERCEEKYGYKTNAHQRVIVEHIKDGRRHWHVMWNRVSLETGKAVWPGLHYNKSKEVSREMEVELGLKRYSSQKKLKIKASKPRAKSEMAKKTAKAPAPYTDIRVLQPVTSSMIAATPEQQSVTPPIRQRKPKKQLETHIPKRPLNKDEALRATHIAWAWENGRTDILALYGIYVSPEALKP